MALKKIKCLQIYLEFCEKALIIFLLSGKALKTQKEIHREGKAYYTLIDFLGGSKCVYVTVTERCLWQQVCLCND